MSQRDGSEVRRASASYRRAGFGKNRGRFFAVCVLSVIAVAVGVAVYRSSVRNSYGAMMGKATELYAQERYDSALSAYREVSLKYPGRAEPLLGIAHAAERVGRTDDAIAAYYSCLELFSVNADQPRSNVFYEIGRLYVTLELWDRARKNFEEAIAADAVNYNAYFALGDSFERLNNPGKALVIYKRALELSPSSGAAREAVERVSLLLTAREEEEKKAALERGYESAFQSGAAALDEKRYGEASDYFAEALAIRSDDARAWIGFAEARSELGDSGGAVKSLERALERDPDSAEAKSKLAEMEKGQNKNPQRRRDRK